MISLSGIYLKIAHFPVKIGLIGGVGGVPEIRFLLESSSFCYLGAHAKIQNPSCLLSGRKVRESEREKEEEEKMASTMATSARAHALRSDQFCKSQDAQTNGIIATVCESSLSVISMIILLTSE